MSQTNLVPNSSFEILDSCPYQDQQVHFASPWQDLCASPDLYNTCAPTWGNNSCPFNWTGYQVPRTGNGYAGIAIYSYYGTSNPEIREYISVQLNGALDSGKFYCVEFYTSRADWAYYAVNRFGVYISLMALIPDNQGDTIDVTPQITWDTSQVLMDTASWMRVSGVYKASGGERYIALGNFYSDTETDTVGQLGGYIWAYYYIDDVAVYELAECHAGNDASICYKDSVQLGVTPMPGVVYSWSPVAGLSNPDISNPRVSPDFTTTYTLTQTECEVVSTSDVMVTVDHGCHNFPSIVIPVMLHGNENLFISGLESNSRLELFDDQGKLVYSQENYQNNFETGNLAAGMYVARLTRPNSEQVIGKFCVIK